VDKKGRRDLWERRLDIVLLPVPGGGRVEGTKDPVGGTSRVSQAE